MFKIKKLFIIVSLLFVAACEKIPDSPFETQIIKIQKGSFFRDRALYVTDISEEFLIETNDIEEKAAKFMKDNKKVLIYYKKQYSYHPVFLGKLISSRTETNYIIENIIDK